MEKRELLDQVWADAIVTECNLTQCIKEIRTALEDDPAKPRFLKTIPRVGYKFMAQVHIISLQEAQTTPKLDSSAPQEPSGREERPSPGKWWCYLATLAGLIVIGLFVHSLLTERPALSFSARDWVLVTDFDNYTGKTVFAAALRTALERELSQSRYVNVVPRG